MRLKSHLVQLFFMIPFVILFGCLDDSQPGAECSTHAVVEDWTDLDGCGYLLLLDNGDYVEPVWRWGWCGTPPLPEGAENDPLRNFTFKHGMHVSIDYEVAESWGSFCMKGTPVFITCISEIHGQAGDSNF